jgi:hypothetical protein
MFVVGTVNITDAADGADVAVITHTCTIAGALDDRIGVLDNLFFFFFYY